MRKVRFFTDGLPMLLGFGMVPAAVVIAVFVLHVPHRLTHRWACDGGAQGTRTWSPDGRWIAFAAKGRCDTEIVAVRPDGAGRHVVTSSFADWPQWSPDGQEILVDTAAGFAVVPTDGGKPKLVHRGSSDEGAAWSPDGKRITFTHGFLPSLGGDYQSTLYEMTSAGTAARHVIGHSCDPGTSSWSPKGRTIAFGCADGLYLLDMGTRKLRRVLEMDFGFEPPKPAWSPDSTRLAYVDSDGVYVVPADGSRPARRLVALQSHGWSDCAEWSPDGRWIVYSAWADNPSDGIYLVQGDGHDPHRIARF